MSDQSAAINVAVGTFVETDARRLSILSSDQQKIPLVAILSRAPSNSRTAGVDSHATAASLAFTAPTYACIESSPVHAIEASDTV